MFPDFHRPVALAGAGGYLGEAVLGQLAARFPGTTVRVLDTRPPAPVAGLDLEHVQGSPADPQALDLLMRDAGAAVHLGVRTRRVHPRRSPDGEGVAMTAFVAAAAARAVPHLLYCSSGEVYGEGARRALTEDDPVVAHSPLARLQITGENLVREFAETGGRSATVLRPFGTYGPGQPAGSMIGRLLHDARLGLPLAVPGDGTQLRAFTYVDDVARGIVAALYRDDRGREPYTVYNLASPEIFSLRDLARQVLSVTGGRGGIVLRPRQLRPGQVVTQVPCIEKAAEELGFYATTLLTQGLSLCSLHADLAAERHSAVA
ncbi:NAD-dependent epimerase/dehydratase family protein [Microbispora sp. NPDC004025]